MTSDCPACFRRDTVVNGQCSHCGVVIPHHVDSWPVRPAAWRRRRQDQDTVGPMTSYARTKQDHAE